MTRFGVVFLVGDAVRLPGRSGAPRATPAPTAIPCIISLRLSMIDLSVQAPRGKQQRQANASRNVRSCGAGLSQFDDRNDTVILGALKNRHNWHVGSVLRRTCDPAIFQKSLDGHQTDSGSVESLHGIQSACYLARNGTLDLFLPPPHASVSLHWIFRFIVPTIKQGTNQAMPRT